MRRAREIVKTSAGFFAVAGLDGGIKQAGSRFRSWWWSSASIPAAAGSWRAARSGPSRSARS